MADFSKFRTSIGGFHRADVSEYIERLCAEHQKELRQCEAEKTALADKLEKAEQTVKTLQEANEALQKGQEEKNVLESLLEEAEHGMAAQRQENQALQEALQEKEAALQAALEPVEPEPEEEADGDGESGEPEAPDYPALELEAYRRAEAAERLAMERAARLRQNLSELLDSVSNRYQEAGQEVHALTEDIRTNLRRLEDTLSDLDLLFDETTGSFDTLDSTEPAALC